MIWIGKEKVRIVEPECLDCLGCNYTVLGHTMANMEFSIPF